LVSKLVTIVTNKFWSINFFVNEIFSCSASKNIILKSKICVMAKPTQGIVVLL